MKYSGLKQSIYNLFGGELLFDILYFVCLLEDFLFKVIKLNSVLSFNNIALDECFFENNFIGFGILF